MTRARWGWLLLAAAWAAAPAVAGADKSGTRPNVLSVPGGPGSVQGLGESFEVTLNSGSVTETVALELPPGTAGMTPRLALVYDSGAGNGPVGLGWALSVPTVQVQTDKGLPRYDGTDRFLYEGAELVPLADGTFRLKNEGAFVRARRSGDGWEVDLPSGTTRRFGLSGEGRVQDAGRVFAWHLEEEVDSSGNRISYFYAKDGGRPYLASVQYNRRPGAADNRVELEYEARPDALADYRSTFKVVTARRLWAIRVFARGVLVRRYTLSYQPSAPLSLLASVTMYGADDATALPPLRLAYTAFTPAQSPLHAMAGAPAALPGSAPDAELADMDGDGFPDVLYASTAGHTFARNLGGTSFEPSRDMPLSPSVALGSTGVDLADLDGDGLVDLVARTGTTAQAFRYFPATGRGQWAPSVVFGNNPSFGVEDGQTRWVDLDFDKLPDALRLTPSSATWWRNAGDGTWSAALPLPLPPGDTALDFADARLKLADVNGDRLLDLVLVRSGSVLWWPGMGRGLFDVPLALAGAPDVGTGLEDRLQLADLNGDGLADLFFADTGHVDYWLLLPSGAFDEKRSLSGTPGAGPSLTRVRTGDMNGNGSADIIWFTPSAAPDERVVYLDAQEGIRPNLLREVQNGLGQVRTLRYSTSAAAFQAAAEAARPWATRLPFSVQLLAESSLADSRGGLYVSRYAYADGYYDAANRELRGFGRVEQLDVGEAEDPSVLTVHEYDLGLVAEALKGREVSRETRAEDGTLLRRQRWTYQPRPYAAGTDGRACTGAELVQADTWVDEGTGAPVLLRETWTYDDHGNVLVHARLGRVLDGDALAGNDESILTRTWANDSVRWLLGRPVEETVSDGTGQVLSRRRHYYDGPDFIGLALGQLGARGLATRTEEWTQGDTWLQARRVAFDAFGNEVAQLTPRGFRREVQYDGDTHTFPVLERLSLDGGRVLEFKASYLPGRPLVESFTGPGGAVTRFTYDALERLTAIIKPGDSRERPTFRYEYVFGNPVSTVTARERPRSGEAETYASLTYFDGLGRTLARVVQAEGGRWMVSERRAYSRRGAALREYDPYFADSPAWTEAAPSSPAVTHTYDVLGRRRSTTFPDGTRTESRHGPLWREDWDAEDLSSASAHRNTPTRFEEDGLGRTVAVTERLGLEALVTTFTYDAAGRRVAVTNAHGQSTRYTYDGAGRLMELLHPDAGRRTFEHDEDGNVVRWRDALGQGVDRTHDAAGRVLTEAHVDARGAEVRRVLWHYDEPSPRLGGAGSPGELSWVEDAAGEEHFAYDARGRLKVDLRIVGGRAYRTEQAYDNLDHVVALTYPDGSTLPYLYNERGLLESVPRVVRHVEYDARGLAVRREFANGVVATAAYDEHDRVQALAAHGPRGQPLQALRYGYDLAGTLLSIDDSIHPDGVLSATRRFTYDDLYRLTYARGPAGVAAASYAYDGVGNLLQKSDLGAYAYEPGAAPNAVRSVAGRPLGYDANGSVVSSFGRSFQYNPRGELQKVTSEDGAVTEYLYDYEGQRVVKTVKRGARSSRTVYIDRFSEERDGQLIKYVFSGDVRLARIGGGPPHALAATTALLQHGLRGLSLLGLIAFLLGAALGTRRWGSWARRAQALGLALVLVSCQGGPANPLADTIFYVTDHLGSAELLTDASGKVVGESRYDAWGLEVAGTDEPYGFTGKEWDAEAGLYYFGSRYYDARIGRFLTVDPAALEAPEKSLEDPQSLHPYSYARNTPTSLRDRDGRLPHILVGALVGAAINTGIYLAKGAINGEGYSWRGALAAAASGAVAGAVVAATGGAGLIVSGALSSAASGVVQRGIETGSLAQAVDPRAIAQDAVIGAASGGLTKVAGTVGRKIIGGVRGRLGNAAEKVTEAARGGCGCFVAGTPVTLASGQQVPIEWIQEGDWVAAPPELARPGLLHAYPVVATFERIAPQVFDLTVEDSRGRVETFTTTAEHPFARLHAGGSAEWTRAENLQVGDSLIHGTTLAWLVRKDVRSEPTRVFNLTVDSAHAYLVGAGQVLVHNTNCLQSLGRAGKQERLRALAGDARVSATDRGWIRQEMNQIERGGRQNIRVPPGKQLAHRRGYEARKGYGYEHSDLQDVDLHRLQHKIEGYK